MNVLITGGAGFIGSNLALKLKESGHNVIVFDSLSVQIHGDNPAETSPLFQAIDGQVEVVVGSVCDEAAWRTLLPRVDAIVHYAAETGTGQSMYEIKRYVDVNIGGTALMLDLLANTAHHVQKVVVASSRSIYGEGKYESSALGIVYPGARIDADMKAGRFDPVCPSTGVPMKALATDEDSKIHPSSVYGITKQNQEQMVMTVCKSLGIAATALRYQNVYGPGQSLSNPYTGILSIFSTRILNHNGIQIFEDGEESRDFVYVDDVVDATILALTSDAANGQCYGVGYGVGVSVLTVAHALVKYLGEEVPISVTGAYRLGDIRHNFADMTKIRDQLGFTPKINFIEGSRRFAEWVLAQPRQQDKYEQSITEMKARGMYK